VGHFFVVSSQYSKLHVSNDTFSFKRIALLRKYSQTRVEQRFRMLRWRVECSDLKER